MSDISLEPLQNQVSSELAGTKVWKILTSDILGNPISLDGIGWEKRFDYTGRNDGQPIYAGYAKPETPTTQVTWILLKFTFVTVNGTDFVSRIQVTTNAWDERATAGVFP